MMLVDANVPLYAEDALSPHHEQMRAWWDAALSGDEPVGLPWLVVLAFLRISTSQRVFENPLTMAEATQRVHSWIEQPSVRIVRPSERHWVVLRELLSAAQAVGNLVNDAHLAALAIENDCTFCSTDADFSRFPGLRWKNPLSEVLR